MKSTILNVEGPKKNVKVVNGTNFVKGDYLDGPKLYEVETTKGTFNLDRDEIKNLLMELGVQFVYITGSVLASLIGSKIDISKIKDK